MKRTILIALLVVLGGALFLKGITVNSGPESDRFYGADCEIIGAQCQVSTEMCQTRTSTGQNVCFKPCGSDSACLAERYEGFDPSNPLGTADSSIGITDQNVSNLEVIRIVESLFDPESYNSMAVTYEITAEKTISKPVGSMSIIVAYQEKLSNPNQCQNLQDFCSIDITASEQGDSYLFNYTIVPQSGNGFSCMNSGSYTIKLINPATEESIDSNVPLTGQTQTLQLTATKESLSSLGSNIQIAVYNQSQGFMCSTNVNTNLLSGVEFAKSRLLSDPRLVRNYGDSCILSDPITYVSSGNAQYKCGDNYACTVVDTNKSSISESIPDANKLFSSSTGTDLAVYAPSIYDNQSYNCGRCYTAREAIAVDGNKLVICGSNGLPERIDLVNNNIADTLAVLGADSAENADFIANCRATGGIPVALGCIDTTPVGIITGLIRIALGTMGGVALIQLIVVGLRYMQGEEGEIKKAREQLVATLTGLATLIFSVLILRILGVNILDIIPAGTI